MTDLNRYWELWGPLWRFLEDFFLDREGINRLVNLMESPVLIVGAGQGLLVEELQKQGLNVQGVELASTMVQYAKERRGLDLVEANAKEMPFADRSYRTSLVATGVVDFLADEQEIQAILDEVRRVTDPQGKLLVGFYQYHPGVESLFKFIDVLTEDGVHRYKRMCEMTRLSCEDPAQYFREVKNSAKAGGLRAFFTLLKVLFFLPRKERGARKRFGRMWKQAREEIDDPEELIRCMPETLPYRKEGQIRALMQRLGQPIHAMTSLTGCILVEV